MTGIVSCQSTAAMSYDLEPFLTLSTETPKNPLVAARGRCCILKSATKFDSRQGPYVELLVHECLDGLALVVELVARPVYDLMNSSINQVLLYFADSHDLTKPFISLQGLFQAWITP